MAICEYCQQEMNTARSCVVAALHVNGEEFRLARHGRALARRAAVRTGGGERCGDCGVAAGGLHHFGCDLQPCPRCNGQLLSCRCHFDEYGPLLPDDSDDSDDDDDLDDDLDDDEFDDDDFDDDEPLQVCAPAGQPVAWDRPPEPVGVDANGNTIERGRINGVEVVIHPMDIPASDVTTVHGIRCTTAVRTVIDVAVDLDTDRIRAIVEDAVRRGLFTEAELQQRLAQPDMATHVGAAAVRRALSR